MGEGQQGDELMTVEKELKCSNCGTVLQFKDGDITVKCPSCSTTSMIKFPIKRIGADDKETVWIEGIGAIGLFHPQAQFIDKDAPARKGLPTFILVIIIIFIVFAAFIIFMLFNE